MHVSFNWSLKPCFTSSGVVERVCGASGLRHRAFRIFGPSYAVTSASLKIADVGTLTSVTPVFSQSAKGKRNKYFIHVLGH